ncbi:radical SAM protein [Streptomyces sp. NPDC056944]|uniref:radical SAM protein n=1 Tax=Streptomyces sp. NPDC056944 TaxID=3345972 RepID=UPI00363292D1
MTTLVERPVRPLAGIQSLELEITGKCQLTCTHCLSDSSPQASHGMMSRADWIDVITDAAALGVRSIQLIGGEPTVHPNWREFAELGLSLGMKVEIFSNLYTVHQSWWDLFTRNGVSLGTSYYSDDPAEHDKVTQKAGSYVRTRTNIREAIRRGVTLRAGIIDILPGQRVAEARAELESMGVKDITTDRVRTVGRATLPGTKLTLDEMCGRCTRGRAAVLPNGDLAGCVLSRDFPAGNVRAKRLVELLGGQEWADLAAKIPPRVTACNPNSDGSDCSPAESEACSPAY